MADKRKASESFGSSSSQLVKRARPEATNTSNAVAVVPGGRTSGALIQSVPRTSGLHSPIMELQGHSGEVFAVRFDPSGQVIASGSFDRSIFLWRTYGECENYRVLNGHRGAVLDLAWSRDSTILFSASADSLLAAWDTETGERLRRYQGHEDIVNTLDVTRRGPEVIFSGSNDGSIGIWDPRQKHCVDYLETNFPITAVAVNDAGSELFTGGIDNEIKAWDLRKRAVAYTMRGHQDTVTSLAISPDGQYLLSNAMDGTVRTWDVRAFAPTNRMQKSFEDAIHLGLERNLIRASWSSDGQKIAAGSGDRTVAIWDVESRKLLYKLPGHKGTVNDVRFSPTEPIIVSGSSDKNLILGEIAK